ncbi:MAG: phosphoesterase [Rickettsiales bacterium]|nr:phosphoesterase [Rickettsiales bacterium]
MKINFRKSLFTLQSDGSIFWNKNKTLILGDLHLEKSSYFAKLGNFLPPYDSIQTLARLNSKIRDLDVKKIILLGDIFHDVKGYSRLRKVAFNKLDKICKDLKVIWIIGNHDGQLAPPTVEIKKNYYFDKVNFNHISDKNSNFEISAHYHPKIYLKIRGKKISRPCFMVSRNKIIIPAYGTYTGGLDIEKEDFKKNFPGHYAKYIFNDKDVFLINSL